MKKAGRLVQARLDEEAQAALEKLVRRHGWSPSEAVRQGLRLLASCQAVSPRRRIVGLGKFSSGLDDLGSNKKHLADFGR